MNRTLYLIDLDDTLLDFKKTQEVALRAVYDNLFSGLEEWAPFKANYDQINHGLWARLAKSEIHLSELRVLRFRMLVEKLGNAPSAPEEIARAYEAHMAEVAEFCPGGYQLAAAASQSGQLVIATNGLAEVQRSRILKAGLGDLASLIWISGEIKLAKPDPAFYLDAIDRLGGRPKQSIAIGDSASTDGLCANLAGIPFWWINWKGAPAEIDAAREFSCTRDASAYLADNN